MTEILRPGTGRLPVAAELLGHVMAWMPPAFKIVGSYQCRPYVGLVLESPLIKGIAIPLEMRAAHFGNTIKIEIIEDTSKKGAVQ